MPETHPNVALVQRVDVTNIASTPEIFADNIVWHFFNPTLPDMHGDYVGLEALQSFFAGLASKTVASFTVNPISIEAVGDELVVVHTVNTLTLEKEKIAVDVVLVWRIVEGKIAEVWDIPSLHVMNRSFL